MHGFHFALGDVPTWLGLMAASVAAIIALRQLRSQQDVIRRQTEQLERRQANKIAVRLLPTAILDIGFDTWSVQVSNGSKRPIRSLRCEMASREGNPLTPLQIARVIEVNPGVSQYLKQPGTQFYLLRPAATVIFAFSRPVEDGQAELSDEDIPVGFTVAFKDDADLPWEINESLHLSRGFTPRSS